MSLTNDKINIDDVMNYLLLEEKINFEIRRVCKLRNKSLFVKHEPAIDELQIGSQNICGKLYWFSMGEEDWESFSFPTKDLFLSNEEIEQKISAEIEIERQKNIQEMERQKQLEIQKSEIQKKIQEEAEFLYYKELKRKYES
jgi:hypothetical protein